MTSGLAPSPEQVLDDLGSKVTHAFVSSVDGARDDLKQFREWRAGWFTTFSARFLANFIHERIWAGMLTGLDGVDGVTLIDKEPRREVHLAHYSIRFKRHSRGNTINSYPTNGTLAFWANAQPTIPGLDHFSLAMGYLWDGETRSIGEPVLSFRAELRKPVWQIRLDAGAGASTQPIGWKPIEPTRPSFDLSDLIEGSAEGTTDGDL